MGWRGPLTHRQFQCWVIWLNQQLNQPTRDNFYMMQIASEVRKTVLKNPNKIKTEDFKIQFHEKADTERPLTEEEFKKRVEFTKSLFLGFMTAPVVIRKDGQTVETMEPPLVKRKRIIDEQQKRMLELKQKRINEQIKSREKLRDRTRNQREKRNG